MIGLDRSPTMLARQQGPVVLGDAIALPFARATFGVVVAINVFDHLADPLTGIREAHRVLRDGGLFVAAASPQPGHCRPHAESTLPSTPWESR